jgi:hypothetical protein
MKTLIVIITQNKIDQRCLDAANAQGCEVLTHVLAPINMHHELDKNKHLNCVRNRNAARLEALKTDAEAFLFIDRDIILPPGAANKFIASGHAVAGGWYKMHEGTNWVAAREMQKGILYFYQSPEKSDTRIDMMGMGCCFMKRNVLEEISFDGRINEVMKIHTGQTFYPGEGYDFVQKAKKYNPVMIDMVCEHLPPTEKYCLIGITAFDAVLKYLTSRPAGETYNIINQILPYREKIYAAED